MKPSEILEKAFAKIEKPEDWTQGTYARDYAGRQTGLFESDAVCFCSMGALRTTPGYTDRAGESALAYLQNAMDDTIPHFNDSKTHAEVVAAWKIAIAKAKEAENETL